MDKIQQQYLIIILFIFIILDILYIRKNKVSESFNYRVRLGYRGYPLDDFCLTYDCTTENGKAAAIKACGDKVQEEAKKDPRCLSSDPNVFKYCKYINCFSNDPLIRSNGCPFDCDINNVVFMSNESSSVSQCVKDKDGNLTLGSDDTGNYCVNEMGNWIHFPPKINNTPIYTFNQDGSFQDINGVKYDKNGKKI
jgi:hypothetical protein